MIRTLSILGPIAALSCAAPAFTAVQPAHAQATTPPARALGRAVRQLCCEMADWDALEKASAVRWSGTGPSLLDRVAADGSAMARGGRLDLAGAPGELIAAGARAGVFTYYMRTPPLNLGETGVVAMLAGAGLKAELARCPVSRGAGRERLWFRVSAPKGDPAIFYAGPQNGGPGDAYALYLTSDLPLLQPQEVERFTDRCDAGQAGPAPAAPAFPDQGYEAVAALLADWMTLGASGRIPYAALRKQAGVKWQAALHKGGGFHIEEVWDEGSPHFAEGELKTATTIMNASAFGDATAATRLYLKHGANLPRGAVFAALQKRGYSLTTLRCGRPYTEESTDWRRITSPEGRSAVLAYRVGLAGAVREEDYALRLDNLLPPIRPGETAAPACRGL